MRRRELSERPRVDNRIPVRQALWIAGVCALLAVVVRLATAGHFWTIDETSWLLRSTQFGDAIAAADFAHASPDLGFDGTAPGVPTMILGSLGRLVWTAGRYLGLDDSSGLPFAQSRNGLASAQFVVAVAVASLIGLLVLLISRWLGTIVAAVAGIVMATEPFMVGHGAVLHVDAVSSLLSVACAVALAIALGLPAPASVPRHPHRWAVAAGVLLGLAVLAKISALTILPTLVLLHAWAVWVHHPRRSQLALAGMGAASAVATFVILYPAMWVDSVGELGMLWRSSRLATTGHQQFFLGEITDTPGPLFYLVALPFRMTPWFLAAACGAVPLLLGIRRLRPVAAALACLAGPTFATISLASKQFDRYGLPILYVLAMASGVLVDHFTRSSNRLGRSAWLRPTALACGLLLFLHSLVVAPWGLAYFNPVIGGPSVAEEAILVGWGEGLEEAGRIIASRQAGPCAATTIHPGRYRIPQAFPCGRLVDDPAAAIYVVVYVNDRQRRSAAELGALVGDRRRVAHVTRAGVRYVDIYECRRACPPQSPEPE